MTGKKMARSRKSAHQKQKQEEARRFLKANWSLVALHTLYQRWGLPTATLKGFLT